MTVVVFGSTGFIGSWATRALARRSEGVVAIVRPESDTWRLGDLAGVEVIRAASSEWPGLLESVRPSTVLALNWGGVRLRDRDDWEIQQQNVVLQRKLAHAAFSSGVRRFVGVGSQAEYGTTRGTIDEATPPAPMTAYARAKVTAQAALRAQAEDASTEWIWARIFSVFGPLETGPWLLPSVAATIRSGGAPSLTSSGDQRWSYLYAADAATAIAELVGNSRAQGIYNVGHPDAPPLRDSVATFVSALNPAAHLTFGESIGRPLTPSVERLAALGWSPLWSAHEALTVTAAWFDGRPVPDPFRLRALLPQLNGRTDD